MDLRQTLPALLPAAIAWAEARAKKAAEAGGALTAAEHEIARQVGVSQPARVRIELVDELPLPDDPVSHELRHVHQYEQHGSIAAFLRVYLRQIVEVGYANAPLEADARAHEIDSPSS